MTKSKQVTESLMKKVKFVGHISKQGDRRRIIIIPSKLHDEVDKFGDDDMIIEIYHAFIEDELDEELPKAERDKPKK
jgi:hypothetical protein